MKMLTTRKDVSEERKAETVIIPAGGLNLKFGR